MALRPKFGLDLNLGLGFNSLDLLTALGEAGLVLGLSQALHHYSSMPSSHRIFNCLLWFDNNYFMANTGHDRLWVENLVI